MASARAFLLQARALLPDDAWETDHAESFRLTIDLAKCEYLAGNLRRGGREFALPLDKARTDEQRVAVSATR